MFFSSEDEVIALTPMWKGERMKDGRPRVGDAVIERLRKLTLEEVWEYTWSNNYEFQVETELKTIHSADKPLVGRALTCTCSPFREDLHAVCKAEAEAFGFEGEYNKSAVGRLVENDVMVVDFYDKAEYGTFFGGNLSTAVANRTQGGGAVVWGGIRDVDQVKKIPNLQIFYRGSHPTAIRDYIMTGYNRPAQIGRAICMPGDIVYGSVGGVCFIPSHFAEETANQAERAHIKDIFGFQRLKEQKYTAAQIDVNPWPKEIWADFMDWFKNNPEMRVFEYLKWEKEIENQQNNINPSRDRYHNGLHYSF
jgi:regulator of RNase E activity RraA